VVSSDCKGDPLVKILFISRSYLPTIAGAEILVHGLAKALVGRGHDVTVIARNTQKLEPAKLKEEENIDGVRVRRVKVHRLLPRAQLYLDPGILSMIFSSDADIVHVFGYHLIFITNASYVAAKIKRVPLVATPIFRPEVPTPYLRYHGRILTNLYWKVLGPRILRLANVVTVLVQSQADFLQAKGLKNIRVIPSAVSLNGEDIITLQEIERFREKFSIGEAKVIISVGRIAKSKGFDLLVRAFAMAHQASADSKLLIIGPDMGCRRELQATVRELGCEGSIIFTGSISNEELHVAYELADIVVHPSLYEVFSLVPLEAWSHKKPIIAFDRVVEPISSQAGILVKYLDVEGLSQAIIRLLSDKELRQNLGRRGYQLVKKFYNWDKVVTSFEEVYYSLI